MNLDREVAAHIHAWKQIRNEHPELSTDDQTFVDTLEGASMLDSVIRRMVRGYREDATLAAALDRHIADLTERKAAIERRADSALKHIGEALTEIKRETGEVPVFEGATYRVTLHPVGFVYFSEKPQPKPPVHALPAAQKLEAMFLEKLEVEASVAQVKAEQDVLEEQRRGLLSRVEKIKQDATEVAQSLIKPGEKSVRLPTVTVTKKQRKRGVVITDADVIFDEFILPPPPPPPREQRINVPLILQKLLADEEVLGAELDNGGADYVTFTVRPQGVKNSS